jgi:hypothetical protein
MLNWGGNCRRRAAFLEFLGKDWAHFSGKWLFDQIIESAQHHKYIGALVNDRKTG